MDNLIPVLVLLAVGGAAVYKVWGPVRTLIRVIRRTNYEQNPQAAPLSRDDAQAVALGQVICEQNMFFANSLETGGGSSDVAEQVKRLANNWDVVDRDSALSAIERFREGGRRALEDLVLEVYLKVEPAERVAVLAEHLPQELMGPAQGMLAEIPQLLAKLKEYELYQEDELPGILERGTLAWDLGRVVYIARAALLVGYLDANQAWQVVRQARAQLGEHFPDWKAYGQSYMLGRAFWSIDDMAFDGLATITKASWTDAESVWLKHPL